MRRVGAAVLLMSLLAWPRGAAAQPGLIAAAPEVDEQTGELVLYVAGRAPDESPAGVDEPRLFIDGEGPLVPAGRDKVSDYAADHTKWTPPIAVGLVYLWCKGAPPAILDGVEALFRHVPARTAVYPTPYGQGRRMVVTKLTASRVAGGDIADYPQLTGDQMNLVDAVVLNVAKLSEDRMPLKMLIIITDGRGPGTGKEYGPFRALGEELRRSGLQVVILDVGAPVDKAESAANVYELAETAHARLVRVEHGSDLVAMIESLAEPLSSSLERMRFPLPWLTARLGGEHRLMLRGLVRGAAARSASATVNLPRHLTDLLLVLAAVVLVVLGAAVVVLRRRRPHPPPPRSHETTPAPRRDPGPAPVAGKVPMTVARGAREPSPHPVRRKTPSPVVLAPLPAPFIPAPAPPRREMPSPPPRVEAALELGPDDLAAVIEVLRVGVPPARGVLALARHLAGRTDDVLAHPRLPTGDPALATRAGQSRLSDLRRLIASHGARDTFVREVGPILCGALRDHTSAREGAWRLRARLVLEAWTTLLRLGPAALDEAITAAATALPDLGPAAARAYVRDVQHELRRGPKVPLAVWLVRVAGPGSAGQTIAIRNTTTVGGPGSPTVIADDDSQLLPNLAEIMIDGNDAILTPISGPVDLDGENAQSGTLLFDAQTLRLGACLYVVRIVRRDVALAPPGAAPPVPTQR
jgi:hypothetical protein